MSKAATEPPEVAGKRLQAKLDALCPRLQPAAHPRGYPISRDEVEQLCEDDAELSRLHQAVTGAAQGDCPLCQSVALRPESAGLLVQWKVDLARLEWRLARVTPACLHCCTASSADALLNAALSVSDAAGEAALRGISAHVLAVNGHAQERGELVQAALNLSHSIKTLAGNLPCRVVQEKAALAPHQVPGLCVEMLHAAARKEGGAAKAGKARKSLAKSPPNAERVASAKRKSAAGGEDADADADAELQVKSAKKGKPTPKKTPAKPPPAAEEAAGARKTPAKTPAKTPGKTPAKTSAKTPQSGKRAAAR